MCSFYCIECVRFILFACILLALSTFRLPFLNKLEVELRSVAVAESNRHTLRLWLPIVPKLL